jgi:hypothetical protein
MKVKTVSVHYGRKVNLGDFNSADVQCTVWADVAEDDDLNLCQSALWEMAKANVKAQILPLAGKGANMSAKETFLGLTMLKEDDHAN